MNVFVLHAGQPELAPFLGRLRVPSGTVLPHAEPEGGRWIVLSWRNPDRGVPACALQPPEAVLRARHPGRLEADLRRHGIASDIRGSFGRPSEGKLIRRFVIPVFQLEALGVFAAGGAGRALGVSRIGRPELVWPADAPAEGALRPPRPIAVRRAERAAVRAVYALGLDYGLVTVRTDEDGAPRIERLDPSPSAAAEPYAPLFADAVHRWQSRRESEREAALRERDGTFRRPLLLGMDPEFVLRRPGPNGKIVSASRYFRPRGRVGCDSVRIGGKLIYPLAELRPSPAAEPRELFRNLYAAMRLAASQIGDASLEWLAGGMPAPGLPLGGHIHVSGVPLDAELIRAMDNYMALPLALIEDSAAKRRRPKYGALGDFRRQPHGGFEYRTLPSWIVSPAVALGVIALARVVCEHYRELTERPLAKPDMQQRYYDGDKAALLPAALRLWSDLERTAAYARYAKPLNRLKRAIERMETWDERQDVRVSWKIPPYRGSIV